MEQIIKDEDLVSTTGAAEILGIYNTDINYIRKQVYPGMLDIFKKIGVSNYYRRSDVLALKKIMDEDCQAENLRNKFKRDVEASERRRSMSFEDKIQKFFDLGKEIETEIKEMHQKHKALVDALKSVSI